MPIHRGSGGGLAPRLRSTRPASVLCRPAPISDAREPVPLSGHLSVRGYQPFGRARMDAPFEQVGAPWLDTTAVLARIRAGRLPGVSILAASRFTPHHPGDGKYADTSSPASAAVTDRGLRSDVTAVYLMAARAAHPDRMRWSRAQFDRLAGGPCCGRRWMAGSPPAGEMTAPWAEALRACGGGGNRSSSIESRVNHGGRSHRSRSGDGSRLVSAGPLAGVSHDPSACRHRAARSSRRAPPAPRSRARPGTARPGVGRRGASSGARRAGSTAASCRPGEVRGRLVGLTDDSVGVVTAKGPRPLACRWWTPSGYIGTARARPGGESLGVWRSAAHRSPRNDRRLSPVRRPGARTVVAPYLLAIGASAGARSGRRAPPGAGVVPRVSGGAFPKTVVRVSARLPHAARRLSFRGYSVAPDAAREREPAEDANDVKLLGALEKPFYAAVDPLVDAADPVRRPAEHHHHHRHRPRAGVRPGLRHGHIRIGGRCSCSAGSPTRSTARWRAAARWSRSSAPSTTRRSTGSATAPPSSASAPFC